MIAALIDGDAGVVGAAIAALAVAIPTMYTTLYTQRKVHRDNRHDHAETAAKVDQLVIRTGVIADDVRDMRADVRDLKATDRQLAQRLDDHINNQGRQA